MSYEKFKKILSKNFNFLYFNEHWGGLKKNKQKIRILKLKVSIYCWKERLNIMIHTVILARRIKL